MPEIEKTCERYLAALKPILTDAEYSDTEKLVNYFILKFCFLLTKLFKECLQLFISYLMQVKHFKENEGYNIHVELKRDDLLNPDTSYISKPWFDMYLSDRVPLPINYNPVIVFNKSKQPENDNQLIKASNMLISSLR